MSHSYHISDQFAPHFMTLQVVGWVDIFSRKVYRDVIIESMKFCRNEKSLEIYAYVIMTNPIHVIWRAKNGIYLISFVTSKNLQEEVLYEEIQKGTESRRDWLLKRFEFAARRNVRNSLHQFWTHENHAVELFSPGFSEQKFDYIHMNPVRAGWVENPEAYIYSSARNYAGLWNLMEIDLI